VQSGISYAAGQLLAVVAPRTVLVVDAPTDWSLAGPLWELALDDAPVDEILDVLVRRGIRTAPSFVIVRVESDAVRALVRGSVPVCFERVGEPVRLDATGAQTWLEGLISGARRVLVGDVESTTTLPYLVSTGVVLVSGLALPCGPAEPEKGGGGTAEPSAVTEAESAENSYFNPPVPVPAGAGVGAYAPVAGREPRVVDLTRSEPRSPARAFSGAGDSRDARDSWSRGSRSKWSSPERSGSELNGHASGVLEAAPEAAPVAGFEAPAGFEPYRPPAAHQSPASFEPTPFPGEVTDDPGELHDIDESVSTETSTETSTENDTQAEAPQESVLEAAPPAQPEVPTPADEMSADPVGAVDEPEIDPADPLGSEQSWPRPAASGSVVEAGDRFGRREAAAPAVVEPLRPAALESALEPAALESALESVAADEAARRAEREQSEPEPLAPVEPTGDLLIEPQADEEPPHPSPADLPSFDPPSVSLPLPSAVGAAGGRPAPFNAYRGADRSRPEQAYGFGGAPAAWPPQPSVAGDRADRSGESEQYDRSDRSDQGARPGAWLDRIESPEVIRESESPADDDELVVDAAEVEVGDVDAPEPTAVDALGAPASEPAAPAPGELPQRVRGRSLRPEHSMPANGRLMGGPPAGSPMPGLAPLQGLSGGRDDQAAPAEPVAGPGADGPASGGLALPAFFRGSRAARQPGATEADYDDPGAAPEPVQSPWSQGNGFNGSAPSPWAPPVRRGGFNGAPAEPALNGTAKDEDTELSGSSSAFLDAGREALREPPRLLGVWCDAGHVTSPDRDECRVCGLAVPSQAPILVARPPLGVLIFDNGDRVEVDRPVILGRDPKAVASPDPETPVLHHVTSPTGQVSRTHAEIRADGWDVVLTDLDAMNGTAITLPGETPTAIEPGVPTVITPGARVDLGGETGFVFEVES
jgi:hypothetical protein